MKYLFISKDKFPPFRVDVTELFGKEMVRHGHKIDFLLQSEVPCEKSYETHWADCRVFVGAMNHGHSILAKIHQYLLDIRNDAIAIDLLRREKYDFILVKDKFFACVMAIILSKIQNIPFIYWLSFPIPEGIIHRSRLPLTRYPFLKRLMGYACRFMLYKIIMPISDHVFVQSELMKKQIEARGIPKGKMTSVPMGVSDDLVKDWSMISSISLSDHPKIVYIGTLVAERKMDFVIRAFKKVLERNPKSKLYLVGSSENIKDIDMLKMEVLNAELSHAVVFTGFLPRIDALAYVQNADVCISPIYPTPILDVGSPTKIIEYMAMEKAVVANDHPEQECILKESAAGIIVPWEENAFAEAICYLLAHPEDAQLMGRRGRQYVLKNRVYSRISDRVNRRFIDLFDANSSRKVERGGASWA